MKHIWAFIERGKIIAAAATKKELINTYFTGDDAKPVKLLVKREKKDRETKR